MMDFSPDESSENAGILYVFPVFRTARLGKKPHHPAEDDLFRGFSAACLQKITGGKAGGTAQPENPPFRDWWPAS